MFTINFKHTCTGLMVFIILSTFCYVLSATALETPSENEEIMPDNSATKEEIVDIWEYVFEKRPDPFLPFIQPQVATKNIQEEDEEVVLTGMQIFEPGQLTLVAIMFSPDKNVAMVEDVSGKGYLINEGLPIGRYGVVSQISMNQVNITETRSVAGKEVVTPVIMRLKKEGDL